MRTWQLCEIGHSRIHINIDTTVETIYGKQQGGRKGHDTKNRGKEGLRPVLCFIEETREYIARNCGQAKQSAGEEVAALIRSFKKYLPGCVKEVILRGDREFISWDAVKAATEEGCDFILGNKACNPCFETSNWYKVKPKDTIEYYEVMYPHSATKASVYSCEDSFTFRHKQGQYSEHDSRVAGLFGFYEYLDDLRQKIRPWLQDGRGHCRHMVRLVVDPAPLCS